MKMAIFHMEEIPTLFLLEKAARKVGFKPHLFHLRDMQFLADGKNLDIKVGKISIKDFSLIFVRGFWHYQTEVSLLAQFCRINNIPLFDSALHTNAIISKNDDLIKMSEAGLPLIKTLSLESTKDTAMLIKELGLPMVAKEIRGKRGFDVFLLKNKTQVQEFLKETMVVDKTLDTKRYEFQEFIPADFDVRVLVLGKKVLGAIERRSNDPNDFRHNISLGGTALQIPVTKEMERMALKAAEVLQFEFAGVDFITNKKTGKLYVLEVNRSPGFEGFMKATGIDVPHELMKYFLPFARKHIK